MKIFLTGEPHVGKSTLLNVIVKKVNNKQGFVTNEVINEGLRTGFEIVSSAGDRAILASVDSDSEIRVSRYGVDVEALNTFIKKLPEIRPDNLLYIDEVGQMELYSERFKRLVNKYLTQTNPFIGTLSSIYNDDFTLELRARQDVEIIEVTVENRDVIRNEIITKVLKYVY